VDEFAADLRRYLVREPVLARHDSVSYRVGKFIRRHLLGLTMASLMAASLLTGTGLAISQARRADAARRLAQSQRQLAEAARRSAEREHAAAVNQRDEAVRERARAESEANRSDERLTQMVALANHSLFDIHAQIQSLPGATQARREIVKTTLRFLEELSKTAGNDNRLRQALGSAYLKLGDVQGYPYGPSLGDSAGALKSYRAAADFLAPLRLARPRDAAILDPWVELQRRIAVLLAASGKVDDATVCLRGVMADAALLGKLRPNDPEAASGEASLLEAMAVVLETRDAGAALVWSRRALTAFEALSIRFPAQETILERLADVHSRNGVALNAVGNLQAALTEYRQCADVRQRLVSAHPNDVARRRDLMLAYGHMAAVLGSPLVPNLGDSEGARANYRKAVELAEQLAKSDKQNLTAQYDLAAVMLRLGIVEVPPSGLQGSLDALRGAAANLESLLRTSPGDSRYRSQLAIAQEFTGNRLRDLGRLPESIAAYRQSLDGADSILAADPANRSAYSQAAATSSGLVRALAASGERQEALGHGQAAIARAEACASHCAEKASCTRYLANAWLALAFAHRTFAQSPSSSPELLDSDWREARTAAERAIWEITAIPGSTGASQYTAPLAEARGLISESAAHLHQ
jgi:tetratricopeptide (TPR) repeat protein